jgi:hypothetical protein
MIIPPIPLFPKALDTDYTLFTVYDTTETKLAAENPAWSKEIDIIPEGSDKPIIWADNGFGNIGGELFYYDSIEKDDEGKVIKLKNCMRQLGGDKSKHQKDKSWIRSYVIAEHHNQLVDCMLKTQNFVGYNYDPRTETLDWRIRNLQALDIVFDDFNCPDVTFSYKITENSSVTGILINYFIIANTSVTFSFRLDFGDGHYTTTDLTGTHRYSINASIDPVLTVSNDQCQIVQGSQAPIAITTPFEIPIPELIPIPDFTVVPCDVPEVDIKLPPLVMPCFSTSAGFSIGDINIPSQVTITPINIPSTVTFENVPSVPSIIYVEPPVPPTIIIDPPIPPTIVIVPPESQIMFDLDVGNLPPLAVDWGMPPEMKVNFAMARAVKNPQRFSVDPKIANEFGEEFADLFEASNKMKIEYEPVGIPEEIRIIPPSEMPDVRLDTSSLPEKILVETSGVIPKEIKIYGPESPIPNSISFDGPPIPDHITVSHNLPTEIEIKGAEKIPAKIEIEFTNTIPNTITVQHDIPSIITVEGCPHTIEVTGFPQGIQLLPPETMPQVEMVYRGSPVELKLNMEEIIGRTEDRKNCFMLTPCL